MNFLDKARKKVENAINDVHIAATSLVGGRVYPGMYVPSQGGYPPGQYQPLGYHGQYPAPVAPPSQWQQPHHFEPADQQYRSPSPVQSFPYYTPSLVFSPALQPGLAPASQHYAPTHVSPGQSYVPSSISSPVLGTPHQPQYFTPIQGQPHQQSPPPNQQYYAPPPPKPHQVDQNLPPAYLNDLLGGPRPTLPALPPRKASTAQSNAIQPEPPVNIMGSKTTQSNVLPSNDLQSNLTPSRSTTATPSPNQQQPPRVQQQSNVPLTILQSRPVQLADQEYSQFKVPHPAVFELPAHDTSNQTSELAATEVRRSSNPPVPNSVMPKPLALSNRQNHPVSLTELTKVKLSCLATEGLRTSSAKFYVPKTSEDFSACDSCYRMFLAPYPDLVSCFELYAGPESIFVCDLSFGRVQEIIRTQCVPHGTLDPIRDFVKVVSTLTPCTGNVISSPGPMWITRSAVIPDLAVCTTCFELHIRLTPFASHFESRIYPETRDWACDIAVPYFKRLLRSELAISPPNFASFAENTNSRFKLPPCTGPGKSIEIWEEQNKYLLFTAKGGTGQVCLSCWSDMIEITPREVDWQLVELVGQDIGKASCDLASSYSKLAMSVAIKHGDTSIWRVIVGLDGKLPPCYGSKGMDEVEAAREIQEKGEIVQWYQMTDAPSVLSCSHCYWLVIQLFGAAYLFSPLKTAPVGDIRQCSWTHSDAPDETLMESADNFENSLDWRGRRLRTALTYGYDTGDWTQLRLVATSVAKEPPPCAGKDRRLKRSSGRRWFGHVRADKASNDDCTICMCEDCFNRNVKGRPGEALFNTDLTDAVYRDEGTEGFICQTYTNRARRFVRAAADSRNLAPFAQYWNNRENLAARRNKWLPILQQQNLKMTMYNQQTSLQMMLKSNAMANALSKKGSAGIVEAVSGETGYRYGNSQIGYDFMTQGSADAAQDWDHAINMQIGYGIGGPMAESMKLHALWEVDNQAFLAVE